MDIPGIFIKQEIPDLYIKHDVANMDFDLDVKVEAEHLEEDWYIETAHEIEDIKRENTDDGYYGELIRVSYEECSLCLNHFYDRFSLLEHNVSHLTIPLTQSKYYQCHYCNVVFIKKSNLHSHIASKHELPCKNSTITNIQCHICHNTFEYKAWHTHMNKEHGALALKCEICDKTFKCRSYLKRHIMYKHCGVAKSWNVKYKEKVKCEECPKEFGNKHLLRVHMKNCHTESAQCSICKSKMKSLAYLRTHIRRVHYDDGKIHKCDICGKEFKSPRYLNIHIKNSHVKSERKVFGTVKCEWCGKCYKNRSRLMLHKNKCYLVSVKSEKVL